MINSELWLNMVQYLQNTVRCKISIQTWETIVYTLKIDSGSIFWSILKKSLLKSVKFKLKKHFFSFFLH